MTESELLVLLTTKLTQAVEDAVYRDDNKAGNDVHFDCQVHLAPNKSGKEVHLIVWPKAAEVVGGKNDGYRPSVEFFMSLDSFIEKSELRGAWVNYCSKEKSDSPFSDSSALVIIGKHPPFDKVIVTIYDRPPHGEKPKTLDP